MNGVLEKLSPQFKTRTQKKFCQTSIKPDDVKGAINFNGGGYDNHKLFEQYETNGGGEPTGAIADAINDSFGSFAEFKKLFSSKTAQFKEADGVGLYTIQIWQSRIQGNAKPNQSKN